MKKKLVYRFRIELEEIEPLIWRTIEVPSTYSFWDLHVAIQDSMGWLDYHLHSYSILPARKRKPVVIGIPDEYGEEMLAGWEVPLNEYFKEPGDEARYEYDFGDGWIHRVLMEGISLSEEQKQYPSCEKGERACPPEDCGGIPGYYHLLEVLAGDRGTEYEDMNEWLKGHAKNYYPHDPEQFDPKTVKFWNPKKRWKMAFEGGR
jgi:hypothetical protein